MCVLWAELQAAQFSGGAQGAVSQLPPVHGTAEQHLHRLVPHQTHTSLSPKDFTPSAGRAMHAAVVQRLLDAPTGQVT